jgi:hypothetical protein
MTLLALLLNVYLWCQNVERQSHHIHSSRWVLFWGRIREQFLNQRGVNQSVYDHQVAEHFNAHGDSWKRVLGRVR